MKPDRRADLIAPPKETRAGKGPAPQGQGKPVQQLPKSADRRADLISPHAGDHARSVARQAEQGRKPRGLAEYLLWFADRWQAEMPTTMHGARVFVGTPDKDGLGASLSTPTELAGGSLLGSPSLNEAFRRLMENSPFETEHANLDGHQQPEPHYVRPIHAAIARLGHKRPLTARWLSGLAASGFDWRGLVARRGWSDEEGELYLEGACYLLWREFDEMPRSREYREAVA